MPVLLPDSLAEACSLLAEEPGRIPLSGGTDLLQDWPQQHARRQATLVDLSRVDELRTIAWTDDALRLGGGATFWDVQESERIRGALPLLGEAARQVGSLQVQMRGTWAGNVVTAAASADGAAALLALDAVLELASTGGSEEMPLSACHVPADRPPRRPDQLVRGIRIPRREYAVQSFEKVGIRAAQTVSVVSLCVVRSEAGWRIVAGGMARTVARCPSLERLVESEASVSSPDALLPLIREDLDPADDLHASAAYRERVLARMLFVKLAELCPWVRGGL